MTSPTPVRSDLPEFSPEPAALPFSARHIGPDAADVARMLEVVGLSSTEELVDRAVPAGIRDGVLDLPEALDETSVTAALRVLAGRNRVVPSMIGLGYFGTRTPAVVRRNVLEDPSWYTAYTPYQPEISQGRLEALLNFQTAVTDLTALDVANASLLDEATAAAEAMTLARRTSKAPAGACSPSTPTCSRRPSPCCAPAPCRWASTS